MYEQPMSQSDADYLISEIQSSFWSTLKRNPTPIEWVNSILAGRAAPVSKQTEVQLNILKPWWMDFQLAQRQTDVALGKFSKRIGDAFLFMTLPRGSDEYLLPSDLTTEARIHAFVRDVATAHKPRTFWQNFRDAIYECARVLRLPRTRNPKDYR